MLLFAPDAMCAPRTLDPGHFQDCMASLIVVVLVIVSSSSILQSPMNSHEGVPCTSNNFHVSVKISSSQPNMSEYCVSEFHIHQRSGSGFLGNSNLATEINCVEKHLYLDERNKRLGAGSALLGFSNCETLLQLLHASLQNKASPLAGRNAHNVPAAGLTSALDRLRSSISTNIIKKGSEFGFTSLTFSEKKLILVPLCSFQMTLGFCLHSKDQKPFPNFASIC